MKSFLTGRYQTVVCEGGSSQVSSVTSDFPQETVLGPLLFLTRVNDLPDGLHSELGFLLTMYYCMVSLKTTQIAKARKLDLNNVFFLNLIFTYFNF